MQLLARAAGGVVNYNCADTQPRILLILDMHNLEHCKKHTKF